MKVMKVIRRFFVPTSVITLLCMVKYKAKVSMRCEVELSKNLKLAKGVQIGSFAKIKTGEGPVSIGANTVVSNGCSILPGQKGVSIGENCLFGSSVTVVSNNYRYDRLNVPICEQGTTSKGVTIGNNVWIGSGSVILDGANIADGSIISPNSVVSSRVAENSIVQGNPAKVIFVRR